MAQRGRDVDIAHNHSRGPEPFHGVHLVYICVVRESWPPPWERMWLPLTHVFMGTRVGASIKGGAAAQ
jgi:hypothetical protein